MGREPRHRGRQRRRCRILRLDGQRLVAKPRGHPVPVRGLRAVAARERLAVQDHEPRGHVPHHRGIKLLQQHHQVSRRPPLHLRSARRHVVPPVGGQLALPCLSRRPCPQRRAEPVPDQVRRHHRRDRTGRDVSEERPPVHPSALLQHGKRDLQRRCQVPQPEPARRPPPVLPSRHVLAAEPHARGCLQRRHQAPLRPAVRQPQVTDQRAQGDRLCTGLAGSSLTTPEDIAISAAPS